MKSEIITASKPAAIRDLWIDEGCIACDLCMHIAPDIFRVTGDTCLIRSDSRPKWRTFSFDIIEASECCPAEVIRVEA